MLSCLRALALGALLLAAPGFAFATTNTPPVSPAGITINGFRSAHFGMDQAAVMKAIKADFGLSGKAVTVGQNPLQHTEFLRITVPNILPQSGVATVDYVLGYKSSALSEVNVTWRVNAASPPAVLLQTGATLQNYFQGEAFAAGTVGANMLLPNGSLLLFRGKDAAGHAVILNLAGTDNKDAKTHKTTLTPQVLTLVYAESPDNPDVFSLQPGTF